MARTARKGVDRALLQALACGATVENAARERPNTAAGGAKQGRRRRTDADILKEWRAGGIVRYYATRFVAQVDGWKQFCAELKIGWDNVTRTEAQARGLAFDREEVDRFVRTETFPVEGDASLARGPVPVETVEEVVQSWHVVLDQLVRKEGGA
jgi:hypothetical protein